MQNISKMEMAKALFSKPYIKTEKTFFGLKTKVTYTTTNSPIVGICQEYTPAEGQKVKEILDAKAGELDEVLQRVGHPETTTNGNFRLNICCSQDYAFAAFHLQQFSGFEYHTIDDIRFVEGSEAEKMLKAFTK